MIVEWDQPTICIEKYHMQYLEIYSRLSEHTHRNTWILKGINNYYDIDCDSDMLRLIVKLSANIRIREFCFSTFLFFLSYLWTFNREYLSSHWTLCSYQKNLHMNTRSWNNFRRYNEHLTLLAQRAFNCVN